MNLMVTLSLCAALLIIQSSQSINRRQSSNALPSEDSSTNCVDILHVDICSKGVKWRYCTGSKTEVDYMKKYCRKSCNFCGTECKNKRLDHYCYQIKLRNHCHKKRNKSYFKKVCSATCRFCTPSCGVAKIRELSEKMSDNSKHGGNSFDIVGGTAATKGYYPWQVAIYYKFEFICGGSLISENKILTAAHCFSGGSKNVLDYTVILGEHNREYPEGTEQEVELKKIIIHEDYQSEGLFNDIAIMILSKNVESTDYISPICLPEKDAELKTGRECKVSGWGRIYSYSEFTKILQNANLPIANQKACEKRNDFHSRVVTNKMICGGYNDGSTFTSGCTGDSGGPLSCEVNGSWKLYGVVSWGPPQCNGLNFYTVFTKVSNYIDWIKKQN